MPSRRITQAAHRTADQHLDKLLALPSARLVLADVSNVAAGAADDGNALVTVTWRGQDVIAAGYASSYTPVAGHRVLCAVVNDQLILAFHVIGYTL